MHRAKLEQVENQLAEARASKADSELQLQVAEKEQRVQELLQKLSDPSTGEDVVIGELQELRREQKVLQYEGDLRDSKLEKSEVMTRLSAKDTSIRLADGRENLRQLQSCEQESQIVELQRQLAEELTQRQAAQKQLVEKERLLKDAWSREEPIDRLSAQQAIQEQVIEKDDGADGAGADDGADGGG
eukprot:g1807.t1